MIALREFKTVAEMRAHYKAVRARIYSPAPKVASPPPALPALPAKPRIPLSVLEQRRDLAEDRRRDLIRQAQLDLNEGAAIVKYCAAYFDVTVEKILEKGKQGGPSLDARHVAAHVMRRWFGRGVKGHPNPHSLAWIGHRINRDHTVILYADARVRNSNYLLEAADVVLQQLNDRRGPYVENESYVHVDPEACTLKRSNISARL